MTNSALLGPVYRVRDIDSPEYQFEELEEHAALLGGIIHVVDGRTEGFQHASSAIEAMS